MPDPRYFLLALATVAAACDRDTEGAAASPAAPDALRDAPSALVGAAPGDPLPRLAALRTRFQLAARPVIGDGVASSFAPTAGGGLRAVMPPEVKRRVARPASVALPEHANGLVRLEDDASHLAITFALEGAAPASIAVAGGLALYPGALDGADVVHRAHAEGTEDFVVFETRPAREELRYTVDVTRVAGLRLLGNSLELLDATGTPRLRVAPPSVVDENGEHPATLDLEGCRFDASPRAPWGRPVTPPGSAVCVVRVAWTGVTYPALVDPAWVATGSMAEARLQHTATVLPSGQVMIAGGFGANGSQDAALSTVEVYDPGSGTFAYTGRMAQPRAGHTATTLGSGEVLMAGGTDYPGTYFNTVLPAELYDASTGIFTLTGSLSVGRYYHTATMLGSGQVLLAGGVDMSAKELASAEIYDPAGAGTFTLTGAMTELRAYHTATMLGSGQVLLVGGFSSPTTADLFDATTGTFAAGATLSDPGRYGHSATLLGSGQVLLAGGGGGGTFELATADLYDPSGSGSFGPTAGTMFGPHAGHSATLLASGKVLIAGGYGLSETELYDPTGSGTFAFAGNMTVARQWHTATLLGSGEILAVGGDGGATLPAVKSAELFTVASGGACATATGCASGFCVDGVCCDTACGGLCQACSAARKGSGADGVCGPVGLGADPDDECPQQAVSTCGTSGACNGQGACSLYAAGTTCVAGSCSGATATAASLCDGSGVCLPGSTTACPAGDVCDPSSQACVVATGSSSSSGGSSAVASSSASSSSGSGDATSSSSATTGAGGAGGGAGSGGSGGALTSSSSTGSGAVSPGQTGGCGCELAGDDRPGGALGATMTMAIAAALRLRRRRRAS